MFADFLSFGLLVFQLRDCLLNNENNPVEIKELLTVSCFMPDY